MINRSVKKTLKLEAAYKDYIWGGFKLKNEWGKNTPFERTGEAWEFSTRSDGESLVSEGEFKGCKLSQILTLESLGKKFISQYAGMKQSGNLHEKLDAPILIKLIDAKENLSVQVHPDDNYAFKNENSLGKSEMWYIIDAEDGAGIYCGFNKDTDKDELASRIKNNTLTKILNFIPCKCGDSFFIPAGTVHAIGKGLTICEIQQNSNITYRLYDYGRIDKDGKTRPLNIDKALDIADCKKYSKPVKAFDDSATRRQLADCKYFKVFEYNSDSGDIFVSDESFAVVNIIQGQGIFGDTLFKKGDTIFVPSNIGNISFKGNGIKFLYTVM